MAAAPQLKSVRCLTTGTCDDVGRQAQGDPGALIWKLSKGSIAFMAHVPSKTRKKIEWLLRRAEGALLPESILDVGGIAPRLARRYAPSGRRQGRARRSWGWRPASTRSAVRSSRRCPWNAAQLRRAVRRRRCTPLPHLERSPHLLPVGGDVPPPREQRLPAARGGQPAALRLRLGGAHLAAGSRARLRRRARRLRRRTCATRRSTGASSPTRTSTTSAAPTCQAGDHAPASRCTSSTRACCPASPSASSSPRRTATSSGAAPGVPDDERGELLEHVQRRQERLPRAGGRPRCCATATPSAPATACTTSPGTARG